MVTPKEEKVALNFTMETQLGHALCWAAVGTSCALFYDPASKWTQCQLAGASIKPSPGDCCTNPENSPCDTPWFLQNEADIGSFVTAQIAHNFHEGFIPFTQLTEELDQGRVVAYLLEIDFDGEIDNMNHFSHFIVIAGYERLGTEENVTIYDPYFGKSDMAYKEFVMNYKCQGGTVEGHAVTHSLAKYTFFSIPNKTA